MTEREPSVARVSREMTDTGGRRLPLPAKLLLSVTPLGLVLALMAGPAAVVPAQPTGLDETVAAGYYRRAEALYHSGDSSRALELVERSLEFRPHSSDSLYLQGLILMEHQETLYRARSAFRLALGSATWLSASPREAESRLAQVLVLTRRYSDAERLLRAATPDQGLGGAGSAQLAELWAMTLVGLGRPAQAEAQLQRALVRYPDTPKLYLLAADLMLRQKRSSEAAALLDRALGGSPASPDLLYARARAERVPARRLDFLRRYFDAGGSDPGAALLMLTSLLTAYDAGTRASREAQGEAAGVAADTAAEPERADQERTALADEAEAALERFFRLGGGRRVRMIDALRDTLLVRQAATAERPEDSGSSTDGLYTRLVQRADAAVAGYSGERVVDSDGDGLYEELYRYTDGWLQLWLIDQDQDGRPEARVEFADGEPARLLFLPGESGGDGVEYRYSRYPYLGDLAYSGEQSTRVYRLTPFRYLSQAVRPVEVQAPTLAAGEADAAGAAAHLGPADHPLGRRLVAGPVTAEAEARRRSSRMEEYLSPGEGEGRPADRVVTFLNGETVRIDEDPDSQGRYRHYILFAGGAPVSGRRDLDDDGVFELSEEYAGGALRRIALDQDGNGTPEMVELYRPGARQAAEKEWDYNDDGRFDSREAVLPDGSVVREFSSRLDGRFDLRAVFREGRLEEFRRDGRLLPVRYDPARNLYRIGATRDWGELPAVLAEGLHWRGGSRLFVFDYGGKTYIGELE
jgi:Tfp pilus assembly protein PilF